MKEEEASWRQVYGLFIEENKCLSEKSVIKPQNNNADTGQLAQASRKPNTRRDDQVELSNRYYCCNNKGHMTRERHARKRDQNRKGNRLI